MFEGQDGQRTLAEPDATDSRGFQQVPARLAEQMGLKPAGAVCCNLTTHWPHSITLNRPVTPLPRPSIAAYLSVAQLMSVHSRRQPTIRLPAEPTNSYASADLIKIILKAQAGHRSIFLLARRSMGINNHVDNCVPLDGFLCGNR